MTPADCDEVWSELDKGQLAKIAQQGPSPVFATISGAHLYGFASSDSDVDLRGAFLTPARSMLGLRPPPETITVEDNSSIELDWVAHDLRKFARLMTNHNGYVLEQLYSPLVVVTSPGHDVLKSLGGGCLTRPTVRHYQGFARSRRKRLHAPNPTVKHLLYAYRVYLTGIHLMQRREIVSHLGVLNRHFGLGVIDELVARKREGAEKMPLDPGELADHNQHLDRLEEELQGAHDASTLPLEPTGVAALDDFVVQLRLDAT